MALTITNLLKRWRRDYPKPSKCTFRGFNSYCVGSAPVNYATGLKSTFPLSPAIRGALLIINPKLTYEAAHEYAHGIINNNDHGRFNAAWQQLELALRYGRKQH